MKRLPRLDGDRLKQAVGNAGFKSLREFGNYIRPEKIGIDASNWVNSICLPPYNKYSRGVTEEQLQKIVDVLHVNKDWLLGKPVFRNDEEARQTIEMYKREYDDAASLSETILIPLMEKAGYRFIQFRHHWKENWPVAVFEDHNHKQYMIRTDALRKIENICADVCASMLKYLKSDSDSIE